MVFGVPSREFVKCLALSSEINSLSVIFNAYFLYEFIINENIGDLLALKG